MKIIIFNPSYTTSLRTKIYASIEYVVDYNNFVSSFYSSFVRKDGEED